MFALMQRIAPLCFLILCASGCVIPLPSKTTSDVGYSKEAIAFLDRPGTTHEVVISSLGPPSAEVPSRHLLYTWQTESRFYYIPPPAPSALNSHSVVVPVKLHNWGLFISFDPHGYVSSHETRPLGNQDPEKACQKWALEHPEQKIKPTVTETK
jgi:hypothetical protein